jgi:streptogramin lyase
MHRLLPIFLLLASTLLATPKHAYLLREAADAAKAGDQATALAKLEEAATLRPDYPRIQLNLARTYAAVERPDDVLVALQRLVDMGLRMNAAADPAFAALKDSPGFQAVAKQLTRGPALAPAGDVAITLPEVTGIIESCLLDPASQTWYFGDVRNRCIWQRDARTGQLRKFTSDEDALDGVFKLALSPDRKTLWATTATVSVMTGEDAEDGKRSALVAIDFATGRVVARFPAAGKGIKHLLGDFIIAEDGTIYATDSTYQAIWRLPPDGKELEVWLENKEFMNLQGLAFSADGQTLYLSDYANGIWRIDVAKKDLALLTVPANATFFGIDGIYAVPGGLLAVQNGVNPQRVLRIEPAAEGASSARVVATGQPDMTDLSLGHVSSDRFHFVGNSGWSLFDPPTENPTAARRVTIYSIPVN